MLFSELFTGKKGAYSISTCDDYESCPLNWATQRSDSDGGGYSLPTPQFVLCREGWGERGPPNPLGSRRGLDEVAAR